MLHNLMLLLNYVAYYDLLLAKVIFARNYSCIIPEIGNNEFTAINSFNIIMEAELKKLNIEYQRINITIKKKVTAITGSNMGGKTSILKTIGQMAMMAKLGLPVPASKAIVPLYDNVFYSGAVNYEDNANLSSFGSEVVNLQKIIDTQGYNLFLLDEFGRGTNPSEGQALFHDVLRFFSINTNTVIVAATHYSPPCNLINFTHLQMIGFTKDFIDKIESENVDISSRLQILSKYMNYQPIEVNENEEIPKTAYLIAKLLGLKI